MYEIVMMAHNQDEIFVSFIYNCNFNSSHEHKIFKTSTDNDSIKTKFCIYNISKLKIKHNRDY